MNDLETLMEINNNLEKADRKTDQIKIHNPIKEVEGALSSFLTTRLNRIEDDANFIDAIRSAINARIPEATMDQLIDLLHTASADNNRAAEGIAKIFVSDTAGKTPIDYLKSNDTETVAAQLYAGTNDPKILQAVTYLGAVLAQMNSKSEGEVEVVD